MARIAVGAVKRALTLVLRDHSPEGPGVRGSNWLALEQDGGSPHKKRGIDYVGMADDPAHIRSGPVNITRF